MNPVEQIAGLSREWPEEKQQEVLDFVESLTARQARKTWTVGERRGIAAKTLGCLAASRTSSAAFAEHKPAAKAAKGRRRK